VAYYLTILLLILFATSLVRNVLKFQKVNAKLEKAKEQLSLTEKENTKIKEKLKSVQTEAYMEKQARDKLGLAKEGEIVLVLPDKDFLKSISPSKHQVEVEALPLPNWQKWLKLFF
jgi:cell division protein DivIC